MLALVVLDVDVDVETIDAVPVVVEVVVAVLAVVAVGGDVDEELVVEDDAVVLVEL